MTDHSAKAREIVKKRCSQFQYDSLQCLRDIELAIAQALTTAHAEGYAEGVNKCVTWHLEEAEGCLKIAEVNADNEMHGEMQLRAADHRIDADELRSLTPRGM